MKKFLFLTALFSVMTLNISFAQFDDLYYDPQTDESIYSNSNGANGSYNENNESYYDDENYDDEYYDDYEYSYSKRLKRFHNRSYFNYYDPFFYDDYYDYGFNSSFFWPSFSISFGPRYYNSWYSRSYYNNYYYPGYYSYNYYDPWYNSW